MKLNQSFWMRDSGGNRDFHYACFILFWKMESKPKSAGAFMSAQQSTNYLFLHHGRKKFRITSGPQSSCGKRIYDALFFAAAPVDFRENRKLIDIFRRLAKQTTPPQESGNEENCSAVQFRDNQVGQSSFSLQPVARTDFERFPGW